MVRMLIRMTQQCCLDRAKVNYTLYGKATTTLQGLEEEFHTNAVIRH